MCSFLCVCFPSIANLDFHHQESLGRREPPQRFMIIGILKRTEKAGYLQITHVPPSSGCPSSRLSIGGLQVTLILSSSLVYRSENHSWFSFNIRTSVQAQCVMSFSRARLRQCLLSDVALMALMIAVFRSFGPVAVFSCAGVSRAVSVPVHTLAWVFAVEGRICLIEIHFWYHRIVTTLGMSPSMLYKAYIGVSL